MEDISRAKILIVDDQELNITLLERILVRSGFTHIYSIMDPLQIQQKLLEIEPDIILLDMHMPGMDGLQVLTLIREQLSADSYLPVLMLTADVTPEVKRRCLEAGVNDFLTKPYDRTEVILRINNLLKTRQLHNQIQQHKNTLEMRVLERTEELQKAKLEMLLLLGRAGEYRDDMTGRHTLRVGRLAELIASRLGLSEEDADRIRKAAPLHDIGKIGIPDEILLKPGRFEPHEFEQMKAHTIIGSSILEGSTFSILKLAGIIAKSHHEKWDGSGYPFGLKGEEIPLEARIVALADFYDALTHERPYKRAWTIQETIEEVKKQSGMHFDPQIANVLIELFNEGILSSLEDEVYV
ncbi:HD domain-containing phosphohydrolase [Paenibacillus sp. Leaf72]|uniref:HD domain-containing phosphohydrolase n=1 Tax=Paenibacillus sp. Leaf72 TaxID=1736234 RepID=UPI0006FC0377|nr:HD domain-containing phosphohydrolase [Paenibacillus sp. Leaf72]KQO12449.1 two-component system response regulator [Paenibacillus sp. Leaf72]